MKRGLSDVHVFNVHGASGARRVDTPSDGIDEGGVQGVFGHCADVVGGEQPVGHVWITEVTGDGGVDIHVSEGK